MRSGQRATRSQSGTAFAIRSTYIFSCNPRNEVIASTNNQTLAANRAFDYDPIGNRLTATEGASNNPTHSKNYTTNTLNQYTTMNTLIFPPTSLFPSPMTPTETCSPMAPEKPASATVKTD